MTGCRTWTILLAYPAGQGDRVATWTFDPSSRTLASLDDEAKWFTEDRLPEDEKPRLLHMPAHGEEATEDAAEPSRQQAPEAYDRRPLESLNHPAGRGPRPAKPQTPKPQPSPEPAPKSEPPSWDEVLFGGPSDES